MNTFLTLACLLILVGPARAVDTADAPVPDAGARGVGAAVPGVGQLPALSVPAIESVPGADISQVPQAGAAAEASLGGLVPAAAAALAAPRAQGAAVGPEIKAAAGLPAAPKAAPQAQAAKPGQAAALRQAQGVSAAAAQDEAGGRRAAQASDRLFDNLEGGRLGADAPVAGSETGAGQAPRLAPASSREAPGRAAAPAAPPYAAFAGIWRKVSGQGSIDRIKVTASPDQVSISWGPSFGYGTGGFSRINAGTIQDEPWRGNAAAPGGLVTRQTVTTFSSGVLSSRSERTETHWVRIPNRLVETHSLELRDGRLIETSQSVLYRKLFFYFGPYSVKTRINTTNLADPVQPKTVTVYEREPAARGGSSGGSQAEASGSRQAAPGAAAGGLLSRAFAAAAPMLAVATPALASTAGGAAHAGLGATALGALIGFVGAGLIGWLRRDKQSGGDIGAGFVVLFNLIKTALYGLAGGVLGAIAATAVHHTGGWGVAVHPGAATVKALVGGAAGFAAGAAAGWLRRDKDPGGDYGAGFAILFNVIRMALYGLGGAVVGAIASSLF